MDFMGSNHVWENIRGHNTNFTTLYQIFFSKIQVYLFSTKIYSGQVTPPEMDDHDFFIISCLWKIFYISENGFEQDEWIAFKTYL